jgi:hypothetical protein
MCWGAGRSSSARKASCRSPSSFSFAVDSLVSELGGSAGAQRRDTTLLAMTVLHVYEVRPQAARSTKRPETYL